MLDGVARQARRSYGSTRRTYLGRLLPRQNRSREADGAARVPRREGHHRRNRRHMNRCARETAVPDSDDEHNKDSD